MKNFAMPMYLVASDILIVHHALISMNETLNVSILRLKMKADGKRCIARALNSKQNATAPWSFFSSYSIVLNRVRRRYSAAYMATLATSPS